MTMRHYGAIVAVTTIPALVLSGCGAKSKPDSSYRGSYRSTYTIPALNETGTFSFSVAQKGGMTGSFVDNVTGTTFSFDGHVENNGSFNGTLRNGATMIPISGTLAITGGAAGGGDFQETRANQVYRGSFAITDNVITPPDANVYQGSYNGSAVVNGSNGVASFTVDARGGIIGSLSNGTETGLFSGVIRTDGLFNGTVAYPSGAVAISGTLARTATGIPQGNFTQTINGQTSIGSFGSPMPLTPDSPYVGAYRGSFALADNSDKGTVSFSVDKKGKLTGSFARSNETGIFSAVVSSDGNFTGTIAYPSGTLTVGGTLIASTNGSPRGDFETGTGANRKAGSFGDPLPLPSNSPYLGSYRGSFTVPALNQSGQVSFTVDAQGTATGAFTRLTEVGTFSGTVSSTGAISGTVTYPSGVVTINGALSKTSNGEPQGDFKQSGSDGKEYAGSFAGLNAQVNSSYRGAYSGSYNIPGLTETGTLSFSVNSRGEINGSWTRDNETGLLTGTVQETGTLAATVVFNSGETLVIGGTLNPTTDGTTSGNFQLTKAGKTYPGTFGTSQTPPAGDSPFLGSYRGTYNVPERSESGNVSFTVDPRGKIIGFYSQSANLPVGTFTAAINNDGTFAGTVTYDPSTNIATRPITGKIATSTVNNKKSGDFVWTINGTNVPGNFEVSIGASEPDSLFRGSYSGSNISDALFIVGETKKPSSDPVSPAPGTITTPIGTVTVVGVAADSIILDVKGKIAGYGSTIALGSMTVDKQGLIVGQLGGFTMKVNVSNDGRLFGTFGGFPVRGAISHQQIKQLETVDIAPVQDKDGNIIDYKITYTYGDKEGIAGDLIITVNGKEYNASIRMIGGTTQ